MTQSLTELDTAHTVKTLQRLANNFERLALANEKDWLANYYTAYAQLRLANLAHGEQIDVFADQAEQYLKKAEALKPEDSEIYALYAYLYSAKVLVDPMVRGSKYGKKSAEYINLAIQANADNPRPYLLRAIGIYHTPKAFGGGAEKAAPYVDKALEKFNIFNPESVNAPNWGKSQAEALHKNSRKK